MQTFVRAYVPGSSVGSLRSVLELCILDVQGSRNGRATLDATGAGRQRSHAEFYQGILRLRWG